MAARRLLGVVAGLLAAAAGLGAAEGLAALISAPSPVVAVGTWAIDTAPTGLREFAIAHFGANDKNVLVTGVLATVALLSAVAGALGVTARRAALSLTVGIGAVALLAGVTVRGAHGSVAVRGAPALLALVVSAASLRWLLTSLGAMPHSAPDGGGSAGAEPRSSGAPEGGARQSPRALCSPSGSGWRRCPRRGSQPIPLRRASQPIRLRPRLADRPAVIIPGRRPGRWIVAASSAPRVASAQSPWSVACCGRPRLVPAASGPRLRCRPRRAPRRWCATPISGCPG